MASDRDFTRRMVRTVLTVAAVAILLAALYAAREALMLIYISALIAMGFSPLVRGIERPRKGSARRRVPRVFAILAIYLAIVAVVVLLGMMIAPPLVDQAVTMWASLPKYFDRFQGFLIKLGVLRQKVTLQEAVQSAPAGTSGNAVETVLFALWGLIGGVFGVITILILSFYFLIEA